MATNWEPVGDPTPVAAAKPAAADRWTPVGEPEPVRRQRDFHIPGVSGRQPKAQPSLDRLKREQPGDYDQNSPDFQERYGTTVAGSVADSFGEDFSLPAGEDVATSVQASLARVPQGTELGLLESRRRQMLGQVRNEAGDLGVPAFEDIPRGEVIDYRSTPAQRREMQATPQYIENEERLSDVRGAGREMALDEQAVAERNPGFWQRATLNAANSTAQSLPAIATGIVTRSPAAAVATMFPATKATSYAQYREQGLNESQAALHANLDAVLEVSTEALPMKALLKEGTPALRRFLNVVGAELPGESVAQITQTLNSHLATLPGDITVEDWVEGVKQGAIELPSTLASVFMSAGAQTGAVSLANKGRNLQNEPVPPASRLEPELEGAPSKAADQSAALAAPDGATPAAAPADPDIERYQLQRTRGELLGRQYEVRPLTEEDFQYIIKPSLPKGHANTLDEYMRKHPTISHVRVERSPGQKDWRLSKAGSLETLRPEADIARQVPDFETPQAKQWAALDGEKTGKVDPDRLDIENDSILTAIAKLGGVSREEAEQNGIDPANFSHRGHRISHTFRKGGLSLDQMAEALNEFGYNVKEDSGNYSANKLLDLIDGELGGKRSRSNQSAMADEIAKLEQRGAEKTAPAEPITMGDMVAHYAEYPGAVEDDTDIGSLHEPEHYPPDFDAGARKLADLAELAESIDPTKVEAALEASTDAESARQLWAIVNGEVDDSTDEEIASLDDDVGEVAAADVQAGQEQPQQGAAVPVDEAPAEEIAPAAARPEENASSPLPPPQDEKVGATNPGGRSIEEKRKAALDYVKRSRARGAKSPDDLGPEIFGGESFQTGRPLVKPGHVRLDGGHEFKLKDLWKETEDSENVGGRSTRELPIVQFRKDAAEIEKKLPAPTAGHTRLWRGNRPGEVGKNPSFTTDLPGIALPFKKAYSGPLSYVDVPSADLAKYEDKVGVATGAEFQLPADLASKATEVGAAERTVPGALVPPPPSRGGPEPVHAGGDRWTQNRGAIPGEPVAFLDGDDDTAKAAVIEVLQEGREGVTYEAIDGKGDLIGRFSTPREAATAAEKHVDGAVASIDEAAHEAATSEVNDKPLPTEAQIEAGNYAKGHVRLHGLDISIENPKGSFRTNYSRKSVEALLKKQVGKQARGQIQASLKHYDDGDLLNAVGVLRAAASVAKEGLDGTAPTKALGKDTWVAKLPAHYGYIKGTKAADGEQLDVFIGDHAQEEGPVWVVDQATVDGSSYDESKAFIGFYDAEEATKAYVGAFEGAFGQKMLRQALGWREFPNAAAFKEWVDSADLTKPAVTAGDGSSISSPTRARHRKEPAEASPAVTSAPSAPSAHEKKWNDLDYGARQDLANSQISSRPIVHRVSGSKWSQLGPSEQVDMAKAMDSPKPTESTHVRELPKDNHRTKLSKYATTLYRETNLEGLDLLVGRTTTDMSMDRIYFADTPEMALGQGANKGVMVEFDPSEIEGTVDLSKPTARMMFVRGKAEYIGTLNHQPVYRKAVRKFTVKPDAAGDRVMKARMKLVFADIERQGWERSSEDDGSFSYTRKESASDIATAPESRTEAPEQGRENALGIDLTTDDVPGVTPEKSKRLADWVKGRLNSRTAFTWDELFKMGNFVFGGTQAEGKYSPKDAYDAVELGVNLYLRGLGMRAVGNKAHIESLERLLELIPTQTKRTGEQDEFQQFSTPPHYAYVAAWVGRPKANETVLEPSAGVGGMAVYALNAEAKVTVNELSPRRAALLRLMGFNHVFEENAEQLNNVLPASVQPTLILANPPFSATAGRQQGKRSTSVGAQHVEQMLKRLEPNGRLVVIVGEGMADDRSAFRDWWREIKAQYNVRANVGIDGSGYRKYGTTFDNQIIVIDKTGPTTGAVVTGKVKHVSELLPLLEGIAHDRPETGKSAEATPAQRSSPAAPAAEVVRPVDTPDRQLDALGTGGGRSGSVRALPGPTGQGNAGKLPAAPGAVEAAPSAGLADIAAERERRAAEQRRTQPSEVTAGGVAPAVGSAPRSDGSDSRVGFEQTEERAGEMTGSIFESYTPQRVKIPGAKKHPGKLVESSAMASVLPPPATHKPNLPQAVITKGLLSDAQLEAVIYAGQAHEQLLEDEAKSRKGYFIGDGTGVGKGREISGIILDNQRQGRRKAIWISEKQGLLKDAQRDFEGVGADPADLFWHGNTKAPDKIDRKEGILFSTYATMRSSEKKTVEGQPPRTRLQQVIDWAGPDFDGVIAFDESHNAGNAVTMRSKRGGTPPSQQALAIVELQRALPKARVVYVSATGATELHNLSYATRLGMWGPGTPFADVTAFINQVSQGGLAAMELVARDLKQMGVYTARSLSYDGVSYSRLQHNLTETQSEIYDELALAWQEVLTNVVAALEQTGGDQNRNAKSAAMSAFWGSHQRFFNQVITSMQMPSVLDDIEQRMAKGDAIVLQLVNTNEAIQERKLAAMGDEEDIDDLDMTPRENLIQYIKNSFPVVQYEEFTDENGNTRTRPALDSKEQPILNAEAVAARDALLVKLEQIRVPEGPLEMIINQFGTKAVAEVTGRRRRVVRDIKTGKNSVETRGRTAAQADAEQFMADKKQIMIFSDAGGTGYSFHADMTKKNQRHRSHYLIQPGWRANKAVQGFGRTHRTNQANAPEYILVTTDLAAQKRFISSIARRLDQLGALTKGQRDTANQGMFTASDNLESEYASDAVYDLFMDMYRGKIKELDFATTTHELGIELVDEEGKLNESKIPPVPKFLNRLLSLTRDRQEVVFNEFNTRLENLVAAAVAAGTFDAGMETLPALSVEVKREETVYTNEQTGAKTNYVELELTRERQLDPFPRSEFHTGLGYHRNKKSGRVWVSWMAGTKTTKKGAVEQRFRMVSPTSERAGTHAELNFAGSGFDQLTPAAAEKMWNAENAELGPTYKMPAHLITGAILPIWDRLEGKIRVVRTQSADGRRYLGRMVHTDDLESTLKRLNVDASFARMAPSEFVTKIKEGNAITLANGWKLFQSQVSNEKRIELNPGRAYLSTSLRLELERSGMFMEKIEWRERWFVPTGEKAAAAIASLVKSRPVIEIKDIEKVDVATAALSHISAETAARQAEFRDQVDLKRVRQKYTQIAERWQGFKGRVIVRMNEYDVPERYSRNFFENGTIGRVQGFLAGDTGDIYLLPGNWTDDSVGERLLFHEAEGHLSIRQFFGEAIVPFLNRVFLVDPVGVKKVGYEHGFYDKDGNPTKRVNFNHRTARLRAADEYIANMAETVNTSSPKSIRRTWDWLVSNFAELMRKVGWRTFKPTEAEIRGLLRRAQSSLVNGKSDKRELSERAMGRAAAVLATKLSKRSPQQQLGLHPSWNSPESTRMDNIVQALQDRHIDTRRVQEAISNFNTTGVIAEDTNVYLQEELFHGRVAKRVQDFLDDELKPLLKEMELRSVDMFEVNRYLHARHARERNEQIASINPDMPDGGSGMETEEAEAYLNGLSDTERDDLVAVAELVDGMLENSRDLLVSYGLESPATIDIWRQAYDHYVPLNREDMDTGAPGTGQGFAVRGPASKRALGSYREVSNILASIAQQREKYLVRGEKNRVANALVGLALENPNEDFWKVDAPPMIRYVHPVTGMVEEMVDPNYKSHDNIVTARVPDNKGNVREHVVVFNKDNERALRMSKALKNLDSDQIGVVLGAFASITRWFAAINTQYNPIFGLVNVYRDVQEGLLNLTSTALAGKQAKIARWVVPAVRGIYIETRDRRDGNRRRSRWADLWEEFQAEGGQTGYRDMFNTGAERAEAIAKEIKEMTSKNPAGVTFRAVRNWLSDYNVAMENGVRLSTYRAGLEAGLSKRQAASIAKNLTVNFNRKGAWGTQAGSLYAFFNASVQGTARLAETLTGPAAKKIVMGGILAGVIQALMMAAAGFDEDDIPEFIQSNNLVIPIPGTDRKYISLPYPLGFRFLPNIGRIATQYVMSGYREAPRRVTDLIGVVMDNFNPIGNAGLSAQTIAPTATDPIVALSENRDWTGQPIAREDRDTLSPTPGHTRAKANSSSFSMGVSQFLNWATGGTDYVPGVFSPTPDQIDYLIGQASGGVGRETLKTMQTGTSLYTGEALPTYKIPLLGRLYGSASDQAGESRTFYNNVKKLNQLRNEIIGRAQDEIEFDSVVEGNPVAGMALDANRIEKLVSDLRREKRRLHKAGAGREDIKEIDTQITEAMAEINRQIADMEKGQ